MGCIITGFDGVQLHGGHGYLLHDFMSKYGNRRSESWGRSLANRCKIVELIIKGVKEKTDNMPVWIKLSAFDNRKNGMNIDESIEIVKRLEQTGLDCVSMCRPFICEPNLVTKLMNGNQRQAKCIMCNYCGLVIEKENTKCLYGKINSSD